MREVPAPRTRPSPAHFRNTAAAPPAFNTALALLPGAPRSIHSTRIGTRGGSRCDTAALMLYAVHGTRHLLRGAAPCDSSSLNLMVRRGSPPRLAGYYGSGTPCSAPDCTAIRVQWAVSPFWQTALADSAVFRADATLPAPTRHSGMGSAVRPRSPPVRIGPIIHRAPMNHPHLCSGPPIVPQHPGISTPERVRHAQYLPFADASMGARL